MQYYDSETNEKKYITLKPKSLILLAILLIIVVAALSIMLTITFAPSMFEEKVAKEHQTDTDYDSMEKYEKLEEVYDYIKEHYTGEIDEQKMIDSATKGLVFGIGDVHADYYTPEEREEYEIMNTGEYAGIGILITFDQEIFTKTVIQVYKNTPAEAAGIKIDDILIKVDGVDINNTNMNDTADMVRGEVGTRVIITVLRGEEEIDIPIIRGIVYIDRADWKMVEGNIGYLRLYEFSGNASQLFDQGIQELVAEGAEGLILDLRNNPGGDVTLLTAIADTLLPKGTILTLIDNNENKKVYSSDADYLGLPLVVLVNGNSASSSESLSGAIKDYEGLGVIIGETTFGKGTGQSYKVFKDGSMLRITTLRFLTPSGHCPQDVGIIPDIEVILNDEVKEDYSLLTTETDNQMQEAIRVVKAIISGDYIVDGE